MAFIGLAPFLGNDTIAVVDVLLSNHVEATVVEASQDLRTGKHLPDLLGTEVVETSGQAQLGTDAVP